MRALDEGSPPEMLAERFPEHASLIKEIAGVQNTLGRVAREIPHPVTNDLHNRLLETEGTVESSFFNNSLFFSMNYKIIVPILVLGLVVLGGVNYLSKKSGTVADSETQMPMAESNGTVQNGNDATQSGETSTSEDATTNTPDTAPPAKTQVAENASVDDVLASYSADTTNEQTAYNNDDGMSADMFAQAGLSDIESDSYDY